MTAISDHQWPPPADWQKFERITCEIFSAEWQCRAERHGRQGQPQHGVDVYGQPNGKAAWHGIQCKQKDRFAGTTVTPAELEEEVRKALNFQPPLARFILATTGDRDVAVQDAARRLTDDHQKRGLFSVEVLFWPDFLALYGKHLDVFRRHYEHILGLVPGAAESPCGPPFRVPPRNPNFAGRKELLRDLHAALASGGPAALTQAMRGLGGVGKTQLAMEYAHRHAAEYAIVWWLRAEEPTQLASDYAALAGPLGIPESQDTKETCIAVRDRLRQTGNWLLVFDNATAPGAIREYLPPAATGQVIITSRHPHWKDFAQPLDVHVFTPEESLDFLNRRLAGAIEAEARLLAETLGHLPLALDQAAAYIEEAGETIAGYIDLFKKCGAEILKRGRPGQDYPETVATTWLLAMRKAKEQCPAAEGLMNLCAFLAPDDIPLDLIVEGAEFLPKPLAEAAKDRLRLNDAVKALQDYSLCRKDPQAQLLSFHRLVQAVAQDALSDDAKLSWCRAALGAVNKAYPFQSDDVRTWPACSRLLPHALAVADHAGALEVEEPTGRILNQAGGYLYGRAQFADARRALERALRIDEKAYGPDHPAVATNVNNLGSVLLAQGDLAEAKAAIERALRIDEKAYGQDHTAVARDVANLGGVLKALGDLAGARAAYEGALRIEEKALGPDHPTVAIMMNNLGGVLKALGDLAGAKVAYERALRIDEKAYGLDHPTVAIRVNNLGSVLKALRDLAGAKAAFERALRIDEKAYGPDHPTVAISVNNLGSVLQALGDLAGARVAFERALRIDEKAYGPDHPTVAIRVNNLGLVLQDLGDLAGGKAAFGRALRVFRKFLGDEHYKTKAVRKNLESLGK
jgi:tetratricopeptide (TPR) repeat protein